MIPSAREGDRIFAPATQIEYMLRFEAALARAEAAVGWIPNEAADAIAATCLEIGEFDPAALERDALHAGTIAIPLIQQLVARSGARRIVQPRIPRPPRILPWRRGPRIP